MIEKLQYKIIIVIMSISIIFITSLSVFSYFSTKQALETSCESLLSAALHYSTESKSLFNQNPTYPILVVSVNYHNDIDILTNHIYNLSEQEIEEIVHTSLTSNSKSGTLDRNLRYMRKSINISEIRIAFTDITTEQTILDKQRSQNIILTVTASTIFFFVSITLSHKLVQPIKNTLEWGGELRKHFSKERCSQTAMPFFAVFPLYFGLFLSPVQNQMHR